LASNTPKCIGGWGSVPDPAEGGHVAPPDPIVGFGSGTPLPNSRVFSAQLLCVKSWLRPCVRWHLFRVSDARYVFTYTWWRDLNDIWVKICDQHVSSRCCKGFQGRKSKVKVTARPNALLRRRHDDGVTSWLTCP